MSKVRFFGADWCVDCRRSKAFLNAMNVEFEINDVEQDKSKADEAQAISGKMSIPVIVFEDGDFLVEPSDRALHTALALRGIIDAPAV